MRYVPAPRQGGFTLLELIVVISVIALIAAIATPALSPNQDKELDAAARNFAAAIRFARNESIRTGNPHGFRFLDTEHKIRVFSVDNSISPWTPVFDVYHPLDKGLYDFTFPPQLAGSATPVVHTPAYRSTCDRRRAVYFDAHGTPWCLEPETALLESFRFDFYTDTASAAVVLNGITGRVTVQ